ncbi:MAG: KTSC domain-containing protein [Deltaproteobacteria bacterium]
MQRIPVASSNLASVGYDLASLTLEIEFHSGSIYQYFNVPESLYTRLMSASSLGVFFHAHIKDRFRFRQVS